MIGECSRVEGRLSKRESSGMEGPIWGGQVNRQFALDGEQRKNRRTR